MQPNKANKAIGGFQYDVIVCINPTSSFKQKESINRKSMAQLVLTKYYIYAEYFGINVSLKTSKFTENVWLGGKSLC